VAFGTVEPMHPTHFILSPGTRIVTRDEADPIGGGAPIAVDALVGSYLTLPQ